MKNACRCNLDQKSVQDHPATHEGVKGCLQPDPFETEGSVCSHTLVIGITNSRYILPYRWINLEIPSREYRLHTIMSSDSH